MGKTSNAAKQKWNASHYKQVKFSTKPETAAAFKAACETAGDTMAGALSMLMLKYAGQLNGQSQMPVIVKTLKDRRKTAAFVHNIIAALLEAEEQFVDNAPENLSETPRYEMAQERIDKLHDVLDAMDEVYND